MNIPGITRSPEINPTRPQKRGWLAKVPKGNAELMWEVLRDMAYLALNEGAGARRAGRAYADNPYDEGAFTREAWNMGYGLQVAAEDFTAGNPAA